MTDQTRPTVRDTSRLLTLGAVCAVVWFALVSLFRAEEGLGADLTWLVSTIVMLIGLACFALAAVAAVRNRR